MTAGIAAANPAAVVMSASEMPGATARSDDFALEVLNAVEHSQAQATAQVPSEVRR